MSDYTHLGTCVVPVPMQLIANAIWRSLDPDVGGASSFDTLQALDGKGEKFILTSALCTAEFAQQAPFLLAYPEVLFGLVVTDYTARWEGLPPPTEEEVASFCSVARIVVTEKNVGLGEHLHELGLILLPLVLEDGDGS